MAIQSDYSNYSCHELRPDWKAFASSYNLVEMIVKLSLIGVVTIFIVSFNLITIIILCNKRYSCYQRFRDMPVTLMASLSLTDLSMGVLVTPICFISLLKGCFPFAKIVCEIQALLISSLFHSSSLLLISIAVDRYICINHPLRYRTIMTKKVHYAMSVFSWVYSFAVYLLLIVPNSQFNFDPTGLFNCEPYYHKDKNIIIVAFMLFFIPSILVIVYCYSAIFCVAHKQLRQIRRDSGKGQGSLKLDNLKEKKKLYSSLIILASISIGFLISISPWTLIEFVSSVWRIKLDRNIEFVVTWIAISNSFWNPIFYGLLNKHFRRSCREFLCRCFWYLKQRGNDYPYNQNNTTLDKSSMQRNTKTNNNNNNTMTLT